MTPYLREQATSAFTSPSPSVSEPKEVRRGQRATGCPVLTLGKPPAQRFSTRSSVPSLGHLEMFKRHNSESSRLGRGFYWHLVSRGRAANNFPPGTGQATLERITQSKRQWC